MPQALRNTLLSFRDLLATAGPFVVLAAALLGAAYWLLDPNPPRQVVLATGPERSAYEEFGKRYAVELKR
ncbi:MAG: C4-dicarboxylate ABC transporter substrate-binding protein, partial [Rhizobacter sp.]